MRQDASDAEVGLHYSRDLAAGLCPRAR
jgi:hypothetical protein